MASEPAQLKRIWLKSAHRGPMDPRESAMLEAGMGIRDNADYGAKRQVTLLDWERWQEAQHRLGVEIDPSARRANLLLTGISLAGSTGQTLRVGRTLLRIQGHTRPCSMLDAAHPNLKAELADNWGGGAYAEILEGGTIRIGDPAAWEEPAPA